MTGSHWHHENWVLSIFLDCGRVQCHLNSRHDTEAENLQTTDFHSLGSCMFSENMMEIVFTSWSVPCVDCLCFTVVLGIGCNKSFSDTSKPAMSKDPGATGDFWEQVLVQNWDNFLVEWEKAHSIVLKSLGSLIRLLSFRSCFCHLFASNLVRCAHMCKSWLCAYPQLLVQWRHVGGLKSACWEDLPWRWANTAYRVFKFFQTVRC